MEKQDYRLVFALFLLFTLFFAVPVHALPSFDHYVRTANYFLKAGTDIQPSLFEKLSSYDVLILPMEAAVYNKDFFEYARKKNPHITILAYVPIRSINIKDLDDGAGIRKRLFDGIQQDWYLRDPAGMLIKAWPNTLPINIASEWKDYLPRFVHDTVLSTHMWDGIFYDEVDSAISFLNGGNIDLNADGNRESDKELDTLWQKAMTHILSRTRELSDTQTLIVINGSSFPTYQPYVNGRMFESFPTPWEGKGRWEDSMSSYLALSKNSEQKPLFIVNGNTGNTGVNTLYQKIRYGLTSTLLGDGFFGFDFGTQDHGQLWMYDEYGVSLGKPSTQPYLANLSTPAMIRPGVWRRDFQQGTVIVNSSSTLEEINLDGEFEKIRGTQDPRINDGSIVTSVAIPPSDGIILLRPLSTIANAAYQNGSFARIFDGKGTVKRNGFFAYDSRLRGSVTIFEAIGSPLLQRLTAQRGSIHIATNGNREYSFSPFASWNGDLNIALNVTDKHNPQLFVSKEFGTGDVSVPKGSKKEPSSIKVFDLSGNMLYSIEPLGKKYFGSLRFALGDLNADGSKELVVATGRGTQPIVRIFDLHGKLLNSGFLAYQKTFKGGVFVAVADTEGNGNGKIITSPDSTGSPLIRVFDSKARALNPGFLAFSNSNKGGVHVMSSDVDGDGKDEIITTTNKVFTYALK